MADDTPDPGAGRGRAPLGSVAEETARLLDALLAGPPGAEEAGGRAYRTARTSGQQQATEALEPCPTCGHVPGASHATSRDGEVCHLCPVCQLLRVVRTVRPETLDRLADLAAAVTETLRDVAATRWRESGARPPRRPRPEVEDIRIEGEDAGDDGAGDDGAGDHGEPDDRGVDEGVW